MTKKFASALNPASPIAMAPSPGTAGEEDHPRDCEKGTDDQMNPAPPVMDWRSALWSAELAVTACPGLPAEP
jgi:hypothetical protein